MNISKCINRNCFLFYIYAIFFIFIQIFPLSSLAAKRIKVCSRNCDYLSPQKAIENSRPGDEIIVGPGIYKGALIIKHSLSLQGEGFPVIDGERKGHVIQVLSGDVKIQGLVIINSKKSDIKEYAGIYAEGINRCLFSDNILNNNTYGIYLSEVSRCDITGNLSISNAKSEVLGGNGIHSWYSSLLNIKRNNLFGHRDGIYLEFSSNLIIEDNTATGSLRYGLHFMFSHDNLFRHNVFRNNQTGVAVMYSKRIHVTENRFEKSSGPSAYGMLMKDISDSILEDNIISENTTGIFLDNCMRNQLKGNVFELNGRAIEIPGSNEENIFRFNIIRSNFFDVSTGTRNSKNKFERNFWDAYEGYDINRDGIGDVYYRPVSVFDYWVSRFPVLSILLLSPVVKFIDLSERIFPVITPSNLKDNFPLMSPQYIQISEDSLHDIYP